MLLRLKNIGKIYDSNHILTIGIRGINLDFDYNEFVTIEGESGSGKSTLLNVIGANDTYEEGEMYFNGMETSHYSEADWEKYREQNIATIFQDFNIIENLTVLENVELALLRIEDIGERRKIAEELIDKVGLTKQKRQKSSKLSGGEKQRTVIARALAKDSPILLADEPTGNLDVKSSREIARLLKEVSKDKLVIVVTHNPEFFKEYATRRVWIFDGAVSEDKVIEQPLPSERKVPPEIHTTRRQNIKNTLRIGVMNYKSRPKFTAMMSFAMIVCAVTLFVIISLFGQSLIQPIKSSLDKTAVTGKVIVTGAGREITPDELDEIAGNAGAGYLLGNRDLSEFIINIPKKSGMLSSYDVICVYAPYSYNLKSGEAMLVLPKSSERDAEKIKSVFVNANIGIETIETETTLKSNQIYLYLGYDDLVKNGMKLRGVNSTVKLGENEWTVYTFEKNAELEDGTVNLINSSAYEAEKYTAVFSVRSNKAYTISSASEKRESVDGLIVQMSEADYNSVFNDPDQSCLQSVLYFENDELAYTAIENFPAGYMGLLSTSKVYVQGAGEIYTNNILYYIALIAASLCFAVLISVIFSRSVKLYQTDFAIYKTLGISRKISSGSLYFQMFLIFLPSIVLLPIVSLISTIIPGSSMTLITAGNYLFIELMLLIIVELVAFGFNKTISGQSIRKSLKRGSK